MSPKKETRSHVSLFLEAPPGFEPGVKDLQSHALPLGYGAKKLERATRFELATHGLGSRYSTTELRPHHIVLLETSVQASLFYPRIAKKSRLQKSLGQILKKETGGLLSKKEIISKGEDLHE